MIRNYVILSLTLLVIIPFLVLDVHASDESTLERNIEDFIANSTVINYANYSAKINNTSSNYDGDPMIYYGIGPKCFDKVLKISPKVNEKSNGDIVLKFTKNFGKHHPQVFLAITGDDINRSITESLTKLDNSKYKITISKDDIINIANSDVSVRVFFFLSQNTTNSDLVISTSESGSPLYYLSNKAHKNNVVLQLPNPTGTEFVNDTIQKISGYTPSNNASISLVDDTVCKYGKINDIFKISSKIELASSPDTLSESSNHQGDAQTHGSGSGSSGLTLDPPTGVPAPQFTSVRILSDSGVTTGYIPVPENGASYTHANMTNKPKVGDLFIPDPTNILSNPLFPTTKFDCNAVVETVSYAIDNSDIPDLAIPDNIKPKAKKKLVALGLNFFAPTSFPQESCSPDPEDSSVYALVTDSEMRVTLYDQSNRSPYYFSPRENITQAQPILACSSANYDSTTQTLKGDTKMCYGINGNDIVIITKRLTGFYGAAKTVTTPTNPVNLDVTGPPTLPPPENIPAPVFRSVAIYSDAGTDTAYVSSPSSAGFSYSDLPTLSKGDIFIPDDTNILSNPLFPTDRDTDCGGIVISASYAINYNLVSDLVMPYNIEPRDRDTIIALGLDFSNPHPSNNTLTISCSPDLNSPSSDPLITDKEMRVTLYETTFKNPYYFSPREGITAAQSIPVCSSSNYDANDQTLKGETKMCYGIHGDNIVIITKQLTGFYGAADNIIDPAATALTLHPPTNAPEPFFGSFRILSDSSIASGYIPVPENGASYTHANMSGKSKVGDLFIPDPTGILSNPLFPTNAEFDCNATVETVSSAIDYSYVPDLTIPSNIEPNDKNSLVALGINFFAYNSFPQESCDPDPEDSSSSPLVTDKEMRVTLDGVATKKPYYFSPRDNVYNAQYIPLCTSSNYDIEDQTLKGDTKMCHGINGNDIVIITKRLTGFYGTANVVN